MCLFSIISIDNRTDINHNSIIVIGLLGAPAHPGRLPARLPGRRGGGLI